MSAFSLSSVADQLPNGFHDAELKFLAVDMALHVAIIEGEAWVAEDGPPEVYRPYRLTLSGLRSLVLPDIPEFCGLGDKWQREFDNAPSFDGYVGWPAGTRQSDEAMIQEPAAYTFFVFSWDECITVQAESAELIWLGAAYNRK
jgi:hypothetical protein